MVPIISSTSARPKGGPLHRFVHAGNYLRATLEAAGLAPLSFAAIVVRRDEGAPAPGHRR